MRPRPEAMRGHTSDAERRGAERSARARRLSAEHPEAAELLTFYAGLAEYQTALVVRSPDAISRGAPFADALPITCLVAAIPGFLAWLEDAAPPRLAEAAIAVRSIGSAEWRQFVKAYATSQDDADVPLPLSSSLDARGAPPPLAAASHLRARQRPQALTGERGSLAGGPLPDDVIAFVVEAVLQPFAEAIARDRREQTDVTMEADTGRTAYCPICAGRPVLGVLREEGHGARRALLCARCLTEWAYLRVVCPACGEQRFDALPVYTADVFAHVRIDACESCRSYVKTIDLTKDGHAVPVVDDIASVSLDLWARDRGYRRLRPGLLRT